MLNRHFFFHLDRLAHAGVVTASVVMARVIAAGVVATNFGDLFWPIFDIALSVLKGDLTISLHIVLLPTAYFDTKTSMDYFGKKVEYTSSISSSFVTPECCMHNL